MTDPIPAAQGQDVAEAAALVEAFRDELARQILADLTAVRRDDRAAEVLALLLAVRGHLGYVDP